MSRINMKVEGRDNGMKVEGHDDSMKVEGHDGGRICFVDMMHGQDYEEKGGDI